MKLKYGQLKFIQYRLDLRLFYFISLGGAQ
jgi:hypothetical protein